MSNTRHAPPGSPLQQKRFASSPDIERGLLANLVALRTESLTREDAELIWWIQHQSHSAGGLDALAAEVLKRNGAKRPSPMAAESEERETVRLMEEKTMAGRRTRDSVQELFDPDEARLAREHEKHLSDLETRIQDSRARAACLEVCQHLPERIAEFCLNPEIPVADGWPAALPRLGSILRQIMAEQAAQAEAAFTHTKLSRLVWAELADAREMGGVTLLHHTAAIGVSHAAKAWADIHSGSGRYVICPSGNDSVGFYREVNRPLGNACGLSFKAVQMRDKAQRVLRTGQLLLIVDCAEFLFPVTDYRYALPERVNWILNDLAQFGVTIVLIAHSKIFETLGFVEKRTGWDRSQFVNQIRIVELPNGLEVPDVRNVAAALLPEADRAVRSKLAEFMIAAPGYLHSGRTAALRAGKIAASHKRQRVTLADMEEALAHWLRPALLAQKSGLGIADAARDKCKATVRNWRPDTEAQASARAAVKRRNAIVTSSDLERAGQPAAPALRRPGSATAVALRQPGRRQLEDFPELSPDAIGVLQAV